MKNVYRQICFIVLAAVMALAFAAPVQAGGIVVRVFNGDARGNTAAFPKNVVVSKYIMRTDMLSVLMSKYSYIESQIAPYGAIPVFCFLY
jgi:hypothetical protein